MFFHRGSFPIGASFADHLWDVAPRNRMSEANAESRPRAHERAPGDSPAVMRADNPSRGRGQDEVNVGHMRGHPRA